MVIIGGNLKTQEKTVINSIKTRKMKKITINRKNTNILLLVKTLQTKNSNELRLDLLVPLQLAFQPNRRHLHAAPLRAHRLIRRHLLLHQLHVEPVSRHDAPALGVRRHTAPLVFDRVLQPLHQQCVVQKEAQHRLERGHVRALPPPQPQPAYKALRLARAVEGEATLVRQRARSQLAEGARWQQVHVEISQPPVLLELLHAARRGRAVGAGSEVQVQTRSC